MREDKDNNGMEFIYSYYTHAGSVKAANQDSLLIEKGKMEQSSFYLCVVCDGMGGLEKGEVASAELIHAFSEWFRKELPGLWNNGKKGSLKEVLRIGMDDLLQRENKKIADYGVRCGFVLGTTVSAMLIIDENYYLIHVGDSRIYEITNAVRQLTVDHSLVAQEVALGKMTEREAELDSRRNVLLQCIGASETIMPQFSSGKVVRNAVYMLCSDGFRHELTPEELLTYMAPGALFSEEQIENVCQSLAQTVMNRGEEDNITVVALRSCEEGK